MGDSIKEMIVKRIATTIQNIAGIQNVQRVGQAPIEYADVPFVVLTQGDDVLEVPGVAPYTTRRLELLASIVTRQTDETDTRSGDEVLNALGADVERALQSDRSIGGLAVDTKPPEWLEIEIEHKLPHIGIALRFAVIYRHLRHDPSVQ